MNIKDLDPNNIKVWHASDSLFKKIDLSKRVDNGNHENSGLGLFTVSKKAEYLLNFGNYIYEIDFLPNLKIKKLKSKDLMKMGSLGYSRKDFEKIGKQLSTEFDLIALLEDNEEIEQFIIINAQSIKEIKRLNQDEVKNTFLNKPKGFVV